MTRLPDDMCAQREREEELMREYMKPPYLRWTLLLDKAQETRRNWLGRLNAKIDILLRRI